MPTPTIPEAYCCPPRLRGWKSSRAWHRGLVYGREPGVAARGPRGRSGARRAHPLICPWPRGPRRPPGDPGRGAAYSPRSSSTRPAPAACAMSPGAWARWSTSSRVTPWRPPAHRRVRRRPRRVVVGVLSSPAPTGCWLRRDHPIEPLTRLQLGLLERAHELVKPGGLFIFCTCTLIAEENEERRAGGVSGARVPRPCGLCRARPPHPPAPRPHGLASSFSRGCGPGRPRDPGPAERPFVLPSLMSADPLRAGCASSTAGSAPGARVFHVDVMDARFVPNLALGSDFARVVAGPIHARGGLVDVHLMVARPG